MTTINAYANIPPTLRQYYDLTPIHNVRWDDDTIVVYWGNYVDCWKWHGEHIWALTWQKTIRRIIPEHNARELKKEF